MKREIRWDCYFGHFVLILSLILLVLVGVASKIFFSAFDVTEMFTFSLDASAPRLAFIFSLSLISIAVVWFGETYVSVEKSKPSFWLVLFGFVLGMCILILGGDFLTLIVGWEALGITSYLLVAFYLSSVSRNGALKTVLFNRVGDVFFVITIALSSISESWILFLFFFLFRICKSAQFPFSAWLPAAIAAPTPISALVHSSTLVTAGLWLIVKFSVGGVLIITLGLITIFLGAFSALIERDLKKVVAFSTLSQLGLLMFSLGAFLKEEAFFHLITHAFFKSILFISVGYWIMTRGHNQQAPTMQSTSPLIQTVAGISLLSIRGCLFFAGFCSKHSIIRLSSRSVLPGLFFILVCRGRFFTRLYRARLISSLIKTKESQVVFSVQLRVILFCLLGGFAVSKLLFPDFEFLPERRTWLSFVFMRWLIWAVVLLVDSDFTSSIFFSSFVRRKRASYSFLNPTVDSLSKGLKQRIWIPTGLDTGFVLLGMLLLLVLLCFYHCSLVRMFGLQPKGGVPVVLISYGLTMLWKIYYALLVSLISEGLGLFWGC